MRLQELAPQFLGVKWNGDDKLTAKCPAHDDRQSSLSCRQIGDRLLVKCFAGCETQTIVETLGLTLSDLFTKNGHSNGNGHKAAQNGFRPKPAQTLAAAQNGRAVDNGNGRQAFPKPTKTIRYEVRDLDGQLKGTHIRFEGADGKKIGGMPWEPTGIKTTEMPLYGSERLADNEWGDTVIVCEGEKAAQSLIDRKFLAVGTVCGASVCPIDAVLEPLRDKHVILWPDNDDPGRHHMEMVSSALQRLGTNDLRQIDWRDAPLRGDAADYAGDVDALIDAAEESELDQPRMKPLGLGELYDLVDEWDRQPWVWEGILPRSSLSLIVGKSESGKSTLIYRLIHAIVKGTELFGRRCEGGRVLYLAGDPVSEIVAGKTFRELGLDREDAIKVVPGALVSSPTGMEDLKRWVKDFRPALVVGDTLAATVQVDTDKYGQSYQAQQPLAAIARKYKPNFLMAHHSQKSAVDTYSVIDAALGSVGVAAVASSRMVTKMYRRAGQRYYTFEMSSLRVGQPLEGEHIVLKLENGLMELGGLWGKKNVELDRELILKAIDKFTEPIALRTLWAEVFPKPKWQQFKPAMDSLVQDGLIVREKRTGKGGGWSFAKAGAEAKSFDWAKRD